QAIQVLVVGPQLRQQAVLVLGGGLGTGGVGDDVARRLDLGHSVPDGHDHGHDGHDDQAAHGHDGVGGAHRRTPCWSWSSTTRSSTTWPSTTSSSAASASSWATNSMASPSSSAVRSAGRRPNRSRNACRASFPSVFNRSARSAATWGLIRPSGSSHRSSAAPTPVTQNARRRAITSAHFTAISGPNWLLPFLG